MLFIIKYFSYELEHYELSGLVLEWFENYLTNKIGHNMLGLIIVLRIQKISFVVSHRVPYRVHCFLYCMLMILHNILDFVLFTDDTAILYSHKDINSKIIMVNEELQKVNNWFHDSQLAKMKSTFLTCPCDKMYRVEALV